MLFIKKTLKHLKIVNYLKMDPAKSLNTMIEDKTANDNDVEADQVESLAKKQKLNDDSTSKNNNDKLVKKRKYALLIGYQGSGYYGLQRNVTNRVHRLVFIL